MSQYALKRETVYTYYPKDIVLRNMSHEEANSFLY